MGELDVLIAGEGVTARVLGLIAGQLGLRVARWAPEPGAWRPRTVALPQSTVDELGFLGAQRGDFDDLLVPLARRPPGRPEPIWLIDEETLLVRLESRLPPAPLLQSPATARVVVRCGASGRRLEQWVSAGTLALQTLRCRRVEPVDPAATPTPAHAFTMRGHDWIWGVEEPGAGAVLFTRARFETPAGVPDAAESGLDLERDCRALGMAAGVPLERLDAEVELGVDPHACEPGELRAGSAQAAVDPISALGLRLAVRAAIRTGIACRALAEGALDAARVREWQATVTALEATMLLAHAAWSYAPPPPGLEAAPGLGARIAPAWTVSLPEGLREAVRRKLVTHYLMREQRWLDVPFARTRAPATHDTLVEDGARLVRADRLGCPLVGIPPAERARADAILACFDRPATPRRVLAAMPATPGEDPQQPALRIIGLQEAGLLIPAAGGLS